MNTLVWIIAATLLVSLISLVGVVTLSLNKNILNKILILLVALSAGTLTGGAFLHLIPESLKNISINTSLMFVIIGLAIFLFIEKVLHLHHCHRGHCDIHTYAHMTLFGDSLHNFIDGLIIAASFIIDFQLGIVSTIAIAVHEIPQEIADFGVLLHGGFSKLKALFYNFISAVTAVLGGLFGFIVSQYSSISLKFLLPIAAGGFIYIGISDLLPEIRKENKISKAAINFIVFLIGIIIMYLLTFIE